MLPLHQAALFLFQFAFHSLLPCSIFRIPCSLFMWLTPGLEPCSSHSQCDTLPVKLKPTFVIEDRLELSPSESNSDPDASGTQLNIFCGSYENRTHSF